MEAGKIDKIVLQISHNQRVSNVCVGCVRSVWFHTQQAEAVTRATAAHFYSSITVTKEVCAHVCVRARTCMCLRES